MLFRSEGLLLRHDADAPVHRRAQRAEATTAARNVRTLAGPGMEEGSAMLGFKTSPGDLVPRVVAGHGAGGAELAGEEEELPRGGGGSPEEGRHRRRLWEMEGRGGEGRSGGGVCGDTGFSGNGNKMGISCGDIGVSLSRVFSISFSHFLFFLRPTCFARMGFEELATQEERSITVCFPQTVTRGP